MIPFNRAYLSGSNQAYIDQVFSSGKLSGDGAFTNRAQLFLQSLLHSRLNLLTHSCTAALEMAALLCECGPGDEILMPSYTFVSTANAFVLRGAQPVFVDICEDSLNISVELLANAITSKTKAIVPVHYAGVSCDMDLITKIAAKENLFVIEDAAQAIGSTYKNKPVGSLGDLSTFSFHETKNISSGEGGCLNINNSELVDRSRVIWEKGTNRHNFKSGKVDKYTWIDIGSSFLPSELTASFLFSQLEQLEYINTQRLQAWNIYHSAFAELETKGIIKRPKIPAECTHNAHIYHIRLSSQAHRDSFISHMLSHGIQCTFHYIPLHSTRFGSEVGKVGSSMQITDLSSSTLVRLPLWVGIKPHLQFIIDKAMLFFS